MSKTIDETFQSILNDFNEQIDATIKSKTSDSANTFRNHLKKVALQNIDWKLKTSCFSTVRSHSDYDKIKDSEQSVENGLLIWQRYELMKKGLGNAVERIAQKYTEHKQLFKQLANKEGDEHFNPLEHHNIEQMEDWIDHAIYKNRVKQYAHSFMRSYKHLLNDDSYQLFSQIYDGDYDRDQIAQQIRKMASFKTSDELNNALSKIIEGEMTPEFIEQKIEQNALNATILYNQNNFLLIDVEDFIACQKLGSSEWCITNHEDDFEDYLYSKSDHSLSDNNYFHTPHRDIFDSILPAKQLIVYDFNVPPTDPNYMMGITISAGFELVAAHNKNDEDIMDELLEDYKNNVLSFVLKNIPYSQEQFKQLLMECPYLAEPILWTHWAKDKGGLAEMRNPLHTMLDLEKDAQAQTGQSMYENTQGNCNLDNKLLYKSFRDYYYFNDIDAQQMTVDLMETYIICSKLDPLKDPDDPDTPPAIGPDNLMRLQCVSNFFNQLDDLEKEVIIKNNSQLVDTFLRHYNDNKLKQYEHQITPAQADFPHLDMEMLNSFENNFTSLILDSPLVNEQTKTFIAYYKNVDAPDNDKINNILIKQIDKGELHPFNVIKNPHFFSPPISDKAVDVVNQSPENTLAPFDNETLQRIAIDERMLDGLSAETCQVMNQHIKNNQESFGALKPSSLDHPIKDFGIAMKDLKDKGIIDDDIIEIHYNPDLLNNDERSHENLFLSPKENNQQRVKMNRM